MKCFVSFLIGLIHCSMAYALGMSAPQPQFTHHAFTPMNGAPSSVAALAQTADGTLWIGGGAGLSRFDGARFVSYPTASDDPLPKNEITVLFATPEGGLWIGYLRGGATFLKNGRADNYGENEGFPSGTTLNFGVDSHGSVWAATSTAVARLEGVRWESDLRTDAFGASVRDFLIDREGTQWVASSNALFARLPGEAAFREIVRAPFGFRVKRLLAQAPTGEIWAASARDLIRIERARGMSDGYVVERQGLTGEFWGSISLDPEGNLWGSRRGLLRIPRDDLPGIEKGREESFYPSRDLSSNEITAFLHDREGNVWAGSSRGLNRFSPSNVTRHPVSCAPGAFAAGDAGSLWIACWSAREITESREGTILSRHDTPELTASYREPNGTVWFAGPNALARVENGRFVVQPLPAQAGDFPVQSLVRDTGGAFWISASRRMFRLQDGVWSDYGNLSGLPKRSAVTATLASDGTLWFGYGDGRLARVKGENVQVLGAQDGLDVGGVLALHVYGDEVWVGGDLGLARFDGARFTSIGSSAGTSFRGTSGIVRAANGDLWLNAISGISRIAKHSVDELRRHPGQRVQVQTYNHMDGIPGMALPLRPVPSAIEGTDGRIWFATSGGIVSIDASRQIRNSLPPPVTIWALTGGERRYRIAGENIALPVNTDRVQIEYSAGSLTVPERVRFRYRLDGVDREWQDAGNHREASYANLGPGDYRFRVIASNNDGVWNETGSSVAFTIKPAYYQTRWFDALCALAVLSVLFALYKLRVRQVSAQIRGRLEARLAERERIARELHDTLLQGVQGLILRFQAATDRISPEEPARDLMEKSLDRADKLLAESREKVKELRPSAAHVRTLEQALAIEGAQLAELHPPAFRISMQGALRDLHPLVHEEGFLIVREAIANAFSHSRATHVEIELTYGGHALQIRVRDDGEGIGSGVLAAGGRPGHFGLVGMRERANKLGAQLQVWSKPGAGTEVELLVPANIAYPSVRRASAGPRRWIAVLRANFLSDRRGIDHAGTSP